MPHTPQKEQHTLQHLGISVEVGHIKNSDKNPVPERAVLELEEELLRQEPGGGPVTGLGLAIATAHLNSQLRSQGLSSRELWTQHNQFTKEQIPVNDLQHIVAKHQARQTNKPFSEAGKGGYRAQVPVPLLHVGEVVHLRISHVLVTAISLLPSTANGVSLRSSLAHNSGLHLTR